MTNHDAESGFEVVLDNRKLLVVFAVLIIFCGCFFVLGFHLGKRQIQDGTQTAAEPQQKLNTETTQAKVGKPSVSTDEETKTVKPAASEQKLDWYKAVSSRETAPAAIPPPTAAKPAVKKPEPEHTALPADKSKPRPNVNAVSYSLQVGAFSQKRALDATAQSLREKGFECRIEPPQAEGQLYHLMVGKFATRADAAEMKLKLQKSGFSSFIKTNQ
jgi:cell division septation protein DedD